MKQLISILIIALCACEQSSHTKTTDEHRDEKTIKEITMAYDSTGSNSSVATKKNIVTVGEKIQGDFDGDGIIDTAEAVLVKRGYGNPIDPDPVEGARADEYAVHFSNKKLPALKIGCCDARLVNEGDLNNDGADDISIFQAPQNGCTYEMSTYSLVQGKWKQIVKLFMIPTGCDYVSDEDVQMRVFKENGTIYYYETDNSTENTKLVKKRAEE